MSSSTFSWTSRKIDAAVNASLQATRGGKEDPFLERNIIKAVSKLNATNLFHCSQRGEVLTAEALMNILYQQRERYQRVCQIADLSYGSFCRRYYKIYMSPTDYENHIKVCLSLEIVQPLLLVNVEFLNTHPAFTCSAFQSYPSDAELINKEIQHFLGLYMLFGGGVYPGSRKKRSQTRGPAAPRKHPASAAGSSRGHATSGHALDATNASDDDDDDFMPPNPSRHLPNVTTARPNVPTTPATGDAGPSRGRAPSRHPPDETPSWDDDDDFMPMPPPWPAPSPMNPEDEATWSPRPRPLPPLRLPPVYPPPPNSSFYHYRHTEWP